MTGTAPAYPAYVSDHGFAEQCTATPGEVEGATVFAFALRIVDTARAQATIDRFLNQPSAGAVRYELLGELALVSFLSADKLICGSEAIGWQPDREAAFWLPLIARGPAHLSDRLVFWMPFIAISVAQGMITGREVWGFRKELGEIDVPAIDADPLHFEAQAMVFDPLANSTQGKIAPLVTVDGPGEPGGLAQVWDDLETAGRAAYDLWQGAGGFKLDGGLIVDTIGHLLRGEVELVNLKQFRDAFDSTLACYQALIEGPCTVTRFGGAGLLPPGFTARIPDWASHRIAWHLGLPMTETIPVEFGSWVKMDFTAAAGREVWRASAGNEPPPPPPGGCLNLGGLLRRLFAGSR
jgi:hypothetical protein